MMVKGNTRDQQGRGVGGGGYGGDLPPGWGLESRMGREHVEGFQSASSGGTQRSCGPKLESMGCDFQ